MSKAAARRPMSEIIAEKRRLQQEEKKQQQEQQQQKSQTTTTGNSSPGDDDENVDWDALELAAWEATPAEVRARSVVAVTYDELMTRCHVSPEGRYPERPNRLSRTMDLLRDERLLVDPKSNVRRLPTYSLPPPPLQQQCEKEEQEKPLPRLATWADLHPAVHEGEAFRAFVEDGTPIPGLGTDLHLDATSRTGALLAARLCIDAALAVAERRARHSFALIRPPGHHSSADACHGFCLINNVAAAASAALRSKTASVKRIAIIDVDVHHGDGTQKICDRMNSNGEEDCELLFVSLHRYDKGAFFPGTGHPSAFGPKGLNLNVAMDTSAPGGTYPFLVICDDTLRVVTDEFVVPLLRDAFRPDLVLLSCGFDAAESDPLGGQGVSSAGYRHFARRVAASVNAPVCGVLEGGYNVEAVSEGVRGIIAGLSEAAAAEQQAPFEWSCKAPKHWATGPAKLDAKIKQHEKQQQDKAADEEGDAEDAEKKSKKVFEVLPATLPDCSPEQLRRLNEAWTRETIKSLKAAYAKHESAHPALLKHF